MQSVSIFTHRQFILIIICICMVYIHSARGICSTHFCENYFCKFLSGWHQYHYVRYREWNLQKLKGIHSAITVDLHKESWNAEEARLDSSEKRRPCWVLYWAILAIFIINQNDKLSQVVLSTQLKWRTNVRKLFFLRSRLIIEKLCFAAVEFTLLLCCSPCFEKLGVRLSPKQLCCYKICNLNVYMCSL